MMMFYADRNDQLVFSWGVARLAGAMFTNTPEGGSQPDEKSLREFENRYQSDLFNLQVQAQIGFVDSRENCAFGPSYDMSRMRIWMQSCRLNNIQHKLVDVRDPASWDVPILVLNEVGLMSDSEISALLDYVKQGNTLIVSGSNGVVDEKYHQRTTAEQELLECKNLVDLNVSYTNPSDPMIFTQMTWLENFWYRGYWGTLNNDAIVKAMPNTRVVTGQGSSTALGWRKLPNYYAQRDILGMPYTHED
jgi:hypothetical protein